VSFVLEPNGTKAFQKGNHMTTKVWVLLMITLQNQGTGSFTIDNISSEAECQRVGELMSDKTEGEFRAQKYRCIEIEKFIQTK
jgi:hypothetical protein